MSVEQIPQEEEKTIEKYTVYTKAPTPKTVNSILFIAAVIIFIAVVLSYFVEDLGIFANLSLKEITFGGAWVAIGCFSISEIIKKIAINRAKQTDIYREIKEKTDKRLERYSRGGYLTYASDYCQAYSDLALKEDRKNFLAAVGIDYAVYERDYLAKSMWSLQRTYKQLSFKQLVAISQANAVKRVYYNADFLRTTVKVKKGTAPSDMYNSEKMNTWKTIKSFVMSIVGGIFAFSIAHDLVVSFDMATVIEVGIKVAVIIMSGAFSAAFGWNLVMDTEISRMNLQLAESKACIKWSIKKHPEYFSDKADPFTDDDKENLQANTKTEDKQ